MFLYVLATSFLDWNLFRFQDRGAPSATLPLPSGLGTRIPAPGGTEHSACSRSWAVAAVLVVALFTAFGGQKLSAQERVDLKLWGVIPGLGFFSHCPVPLEDAAALNPIVGNIRGKIGLHLYFNRFDGDTEKIALPSYLTSGFLSADFTGDGLVDFLANGTENGIYLLPGVRSIHPTVSLPVQVAQNSFDTYSRLVYDFDKDGKSDIVSPTYNSLGFLLFGNHPDSLWKSQPLQAPDFSKYSVIPQAFFLHRDKLRVIAIVKTGAFEYLYQFQVDTVSQDAPIKLRAIGWVRGMTDRLPDGRFSPYWLYDASSLYQDNGTGENFYVAGRYSGVSDVYKLTDTGFTLITQRSGVWAFYESVIGASIDGDTINDMLVYSYKVIDGDSVLGIEFFSKAPWYPESRSLGWIWRHGWIQECIKPVGDVNGDGLIDIGRIGEPGLMIYLSGSGVVSAGNESMGQGSDEIIISPSPVKKSGVLTVRGSTSQVLLSSIELINLQGGIVTRAQSEAPTSEIQVGLADRHLATGTYTIRAKTTRGTAFKNLIVVED